MEIALKPENLISISGANQRFFEIEMNDGRRFIVHPSRPNYCLESSILFGDELVKLCKCEFTNYGTYRAISPDSVPKCAMYTCNLQYELDDSVVTFPWPILVFEHFGFCDLKKEDLFDTALDLFAPDILLGNWACREDEEKLTKGSEAIYARRSSDDGIIRVSVDRALGCTYPEDRQKNKQALSGCEFDDDPHDMINALRNDDSSRWLYGGLRKKDVDEIFMKILQDGALYEKICSIIDVSSNGGWPPFYGLKNHHGKNVHEILLDRIEKITNQFPYYKMKYAQSINRSIMEPLARDGHVAQAYNGYMYIFGGNSAKGALNDIWKLNTQNKSWTMIDKRIPGDGRYSFTGNIYKDRYLILFGGEKRVNQQTDEIFAFDLSTETFVGITEMGTRPTRRCRHASYISQKSEIVITGGYNDNKN
jgi:hypothetical protein